MEEKTIKKRTLGRFAHVVIILIILCMIMLFCALASLWSYLEKYENSTPQSYINQFLSYVENGDMNTLMKSVGVKNTEFFSEKDYGKYLHNTLGAEMNKVLVDEMGSDESGNKQLYHLHLNEKEGITLALTKQQSKNKMSQYLIAQIDLPYKELTVFAPEHATILANKIKLGEQHKLKEQKSIQGFQTLNNQALAPKMVSYKISGFLELPTITVDGMDKNAYHIETKNNVVTITTAPEVSIKEKIEETAIIASKAYANFVSHDGEFDTFKQYVLKETSYYKAIHNFDNQWYVSHNGVAFENVVITNTTAYSDECYSTEVSFDYIVSQNKLRRTYATKYKLYFLKEGSSYKIVNLELK